MEKLQLAPDARLTLLTVTVEVPDIVEPEPQKPESGNAVAAKPDKAAFKSAVKPNPVISLSLSTLVKLKLRLMLSPGDAKEEKLMAITELLLIGFCTVNKALAAPLVPAFEDNAPVLSAYSPGVDGATTSKLIVQEAPALTSASLTVSVVSDKVTDPKVNPNWTLRGQLCVKLVVEAGVIPLLPKT